MLESKGISVKLLGPEAALAIFMEVERVLLAENQMKINEDHILREVLI
jgi:uncharacterized protein YacL (UPF0231 family)